ncbi:hypothetical protein O3P69_005456 [Scylla paramamosain]|uniref:Uncharacterized protein n=1 Tax=Scylla paramamosain TaxID=85552 RepID=A0AAW0UBT5_SCYPA
MMREGLRPRLFLALFCLARSGSAKKTGVPLEVGISVLVRNLAKIDESEGMVMMEVNLRVKWRDTRLRPPPDLEPSQYVPLDPAILTRIWVPDLYIDHSSGANTPRVLTSIASVWIYGDTTVDYSGNMFVELSCRMDYAWFPRDHQICSFRMESYAYTLDRNVYVWVPPGLEVSKMIHSEQFLVRFEEADPYTRVQDVYGTYPALAFRVHLTRRLSYMLLQVYLPSGLFVVVSFVSLLVPADAIPGRMTLCITTILTMSALLGVAMPLVTCLRIQVLKFSIPYRQSTPRVSYVRAIDVWLLSCLSFVSIVLLEFGAVIKHPSAQDTPATHQEQKQQNVKNCSWILGDSLKISLPSSKKVDRVSLVLLPSFFFVFNLAYWGWFLSGSQAAIPSLKGNNATVEAS